MLNSFIQRLNVTAFLVKYKINTCHDSYVGYGVSLVDVSSRCLLSGTPYVMTGFAA